MQKNNIILIGMPGAGKSTIGVILAKVAGKEFLDSDLIIQNKEQRLLKDIISQDGLDAFIKIENDINASLSCVNTVIATGGSVIYGQEAMEHLQNIGTVVYIKLSYKTLVKRLSNIKQRGVVLRNGQNLRDLYEERCPLYEKYAHIVVDGEKKGVEELMQKILDELTKFQHD